MSMIRIEKEDNGNIEVYEYDTSTTTGNGIEPQSHQIYWLISENEFVNDIQVLRYFGRAGLLVTSYR